MINKFFIIIIKFYKYFISPFFPVSCRYLPTCSEYFIDSIKLNGIFKGSFLGIKNNYEINIIEDLEFLNDSTYFHKNRNIKYNISKSSNIKQNLVQNEESTSDNYIRSDTTILTNNKLGLLPKDLNLLLLPRL